MLCGSNNYCKIVFFVFLKILCIIAIFYYYKNVMISKDKLKLLQSGFRSDEITCKNVVIQNYKRFFELLKVSVQDPYTYSLLPRESTIVWLERGVYIPEKWELFFDYFMQTHSMFCEKNDISIDNVARLYKFSFSSWEELVISFSSPKFTTADLPKNIIVIENFNTNEVYKKQIDSILWDIIYAEYAFFSKYVQGKKKVIDNASWAICEIL